MTTTTVHTLEKKTPGDSSENPHEKVQSIRETVESIVVAFILAFLFRAFVAEAFVIPTGSMAPTLMGAHKDTVCEHCGKQYQCSASSEFDLNGATGALTNYLVVASTCPTCRGVNAYDLQNAPNHATFSGDRILVSKFDYVLHDPERWDVIVFKYPKNARMNYIKRLVGKPGETLRIKGGDVYLRHKDSDPWTIARKPPHKINAMRQIVADTNFQPRALVAAGWPSLWQAMNTSQTSASQWQVAQSEDKWSAELTQSDSPQWLRYYHKFLTFPEWQTFESSQQLPVVDPLSSRLITDYQGYNTSYTTFRNEVYDPSGRITLGGQGKVRPYYALQDNKIWTDHPSESLNVTQPQNDGDNWVGDLAGEFDVDITSDTGVLSLMLVENGIQFRCDINIATGDATLTALDEADQEVAIFDGGSHPATASLTAKTSIKGKGSHQLEIANFDDQIVLWADGSPVAFSSPAEFSLDSIRTETERRPHWSTTNPLDAAPVAIGGQGVAMKVARAKVWRDIYYIAIKSSQQYTDYSTVMPDDFVSAIPDREGRNAVGQYRESTQLAIQAIYSHPEWWSKTSLFNLRGERTYELAADQYFPMGDNSAQSLDARAWDNHNYVEQRFMLGKALMVFWPHYWNRPIPFFPNFSRMGLIR